MPGSATCFPLRLQQTKVRPVRLITVAVVLTTVPDLEDEAHSFEPLHGPYDRAPALTDEMRDPIKTRVALMSAPVEAVDDRGRHLLFRAVQGYGQADRLECECRV